MESSLHRGHKYCTNGNDITFIFIISTLLTLLSLRQIDNISVIVFTTYSILGAVMYP